MEVLFVLAFIVFLIVAFDDGPGRKNHPGNGDDF